MEVLTRVKVLTSMNLIVLYSRKGKASFRKEIAEISLICNPFWSLSLNGYTVLCNPLTSIRRGLLVRFFVDSDGEFNRL